MLSKGVRADGRRLLDYRSILVSPGVIQRAEGSALAKIGGTVVVAGVKCGIGTPFPDTPTQGVLTVNAEFVMQLIYAIYIIHNKYTRATLY